MRRNRWKLIPKKSFPLLVKGFVISPKFLIIFPFKWLNYTNSNTIFWIFSAITKRLFSRCNIIIVKTKHYLTCNRWRFLIASSMINRNCSSLSSSSSSSSSSVNVNQKKIIDFEKKTYTFIITKLVQGYD